MWSVFLVSTVLGRCDGSCSYTCYDNGSKYSNIAGTDRLLSVRIGYVVEDNVLCTKHNHIQLNMVVEYFASMVRVFGFSDIENSQLTAAYNNAKANRLWSLSSLAMEDEANYFSFATSAFFLVNLESETDGMTECPGHACSTEAEVQLNIHNHDPPVVRPAESCVLQRSPGVTERVTICPE